MKPLQAISPLRYWNMYREGSEAAEASGEQVLWALPEEAGHVEPREKKAQWDLLAHYSNVGAVFSHK